LSASSFLPPTCNPPSVGQDERCQCSCALLSQSILLAIGNQNLPLSFLSPGPRLSFGPRDQLCRVLLHIPFSFLQLVLAAVVLRPNLPKVCNPFSSIVCPMLSPLEPSPWVISPPTLPGSFPHNPKIEQVKCGFLLLIDSPPHSVCGQALPLLIPFLRLLPVPPTFAPFLLLPSSRLQGRPGPHISPFCALFPPVGLLSSMEGFQTPFPPFLLPFAHVSGSGAD